MADPIKRALTRRRRIPGRPVIIEEPNEKLVLGVKFGIGMTVCLSLLEIAHMAFMGTWNSEIFAAITGLSGTVMGVFVGQKS
ncbi:MAG: hypothetical protein QM398_02850 [Thermoproteota archaeon]|nr:hypothetical protein [Thermoproteota archaeon]NLD66150.1 hypothetical protein [Thermoproteota archaeon]